MYADDSYSLTWSLLGWATANLSLLPSGSCSIVGEFPMFPYQTILQPQILHAQVVAQHSLKIACLDLAFLEDTAAVPSQSTPMLTLRWVLNPAPTGPL